MTLTNTTAEELKLIEAHIKCYSAISKQAITKIWRDQDGFLCVSYKLEDGSERWFHYNWKTKEWW